MVFSPEMISVIQKNTYNIELILPLVEKTLCMMLRHVHVPLWGMRVLDSFGASTGWTGWCDYWTLCHRRIRMANPSCLHVRISLESVDQLGPLSECGPRTLLVRVYVCTWGTACRQTHWQSRGLAAVSSSSPKELRDLGADIIKYIHVTRDCLLDIFRRLLLIPYSASTCLQRFLSPLQDICLWESVNRLFWAATRVIKRLAGKHVSPVWYQSACESIDIVSSVDFHHVGSCGVVKRWNLL